MMFDETGAMKDVKVGPIVETKIKSLSSILSPGFLLFLLSCSLQIKVQKPKI